MTDMVDTLVEETGDALVDVAAAAGSTVMDLAEGAAGLVLDETASPKKRKGLALILILLVAAGVVYWMKSKENDDQ